MSRSFRIKFRAIHEIWNTKCFYCRKELDYKTTKTDNAASVEHLKPEAKGGTYSKYNVVIACRKCNGERNTKNWMLFLLKKILEKL